MKTMGKIKHLKLQFISVFLAKEKKKSQISVAEMQTVSFPLSFLPLQN